MYIIKNEYGRYFCDIVCGCIVWKDHHSRALIYSERISAENAILIHKLKGCTVIHYDKEDNR